MYSPLEQRLVALEQLLAGVEEQALAEAPGTRQKEMLALVEQPADIGRLIDVVAIVFADLAESLNADGQFAFVHGRILRWDYPPSICAALSSWAWV